MTSNRCTDAATKVALSRYQTELFDPAENEPAIDEMRTQISYAIEELELALESLDELKSLQSD